ncbi:serine hydrolase domain-containing protein [Streptomyces sp. GQFP]|uniref:serine hydrolase domain-containing protein n=1 Tax=Streptomyces sp. GQFP TaxID=2907545 RepID=UPI001F1D7B44|nr:serine hydrolase domain-containing protein [Streptomyces sp. GQFP]UIX28806.1 beta-lactamase family protein [Streptomyces sp. GQFP]
MVETSGTSGTCTDQFAPVRAALEASLDDKDVGASVAVYLDGEPVVDLWGGHLDEARTVPWERDTLTNTWSTTKTMTALSALVLADRGELDLDAPVARYWPEFAANGKDDVRVRYLLGHTAGLPTWDEPMTLDDLYDWPTATSRLAAQAPAWKPGVEGGYHAVTYGHLVGEVIRRVTGRTPGVFFAEEIAGPLGADFHIGLPAEHDHRVAPVIAPPERVLDPNAALPRDRPGNPHLPPATGNTEAWRRAEIPAANGHGNARSVAAVQSVLSCGGTARGVRLLSEAGCERALEEQFRGTDNTLGVPMRWGMGYGLHSGQLPNPRTCFWGGWGGSLVLVDMDARLTVAYVMNRMLDPEGLGDERAFLILAAAYEGLSV